MPARGRFEVGSGITRFRHIAIAAALVLAVFAVYAPVVGFDFVDYDDRSYVSENPDVQRGLTVRTVAWAFTSRVVSHWHPVTMLSHALDWSLFGAWAGGHHATSVALHAGNALLLLALLVRLTGAPGRSAVVAGLFALHPLRVESVAWIAERKDVLSAAFFLAALHAYASWVRRPSPARYAWLLAAFACGLLAKPMVLTLPAVLLLLDHWPLRRGVPPGRLVVEKLPLVALGVGSALATVAAAREGALATLPHVALPLRIENAVAALGWYLRKSVWPSELGVLYLHPAAPGGLPIAPAALAAGAVALAAIPLWVLVERHRRYLATGWAWGLVMLLPVLGFVQAGLQARADRYTYLAMIGPAVALVWRVGDWLDEHAAAGVRRGVAAAMAAVLAAYAVAARAQVAVWRDSVTLYRHATEVEPHNFMMHYNLGTQLNGLQRHDEALAAFRRSDALHPRHARTKRALGEALERRGDLAGALAAYAEAVRLQPDDASHRRVLADALLASGETAAAIDEYRRALALDGDDATAHNNLGNALLAAGEREAARAAYEEALRLGPALGEAHGNLAAWHEASGDRDLALAHRRAHARLAPASAEARLALGEALLRTGDADAALAALREAHRLEPRGGPAERLLAWVLATRPSASAADGAEAARLAERHVAAGGEADAMALLTLAVAEAAAGRFAEARAAAARARARAAADGDRELLAAIAAVDGRFQRGEPYREAP